MIPKKKRDIEDEKRVTQHEISKTMRKEIIDWKKVVKYRPRKQSNLNFVKFFDQEVENTGKQFLPVLVKCKKPFAVADRWAKSKMQYPYFTTFVLNMIYMAHHAMTKSNAKIDINAQADLDLMTHLLHANAIVSNETKFLRQAFDDIWKPRGKLIFTSEEFAEFIS